MVCKYMMPWPLHCKIKEKFHPKKELTSQNNPLRILNIDSVLLFYCRFLKFLLAHVLSEFLNVSDRARDK